jgi:uncharacterized membrane protein
VRQLVAGLIHIVPVVTVPVAIGVVSTATFFKGFFQVFTEGFFKFFF